METEISAGALKGTLLSAGKHDPVVLIVPGSGPTDRDGNSPLGVKANTYRLLAKEPADRYASASVFLNDLATVSAVCSAPASETQAGVESCIPG